MHIGTVVFANRHDKPDGADLAGRQPLCCGIGAISRLLGGLHDATARLRAHLGIAVERPADGGLRNAQQLRQLFQVHVFNFLHACTPGSGKSLSSRSQSALDFYQPHRVFSIKNDSRLLK